MNFNSFWILDPTDKYLEDMMAEAPGPINFTMFLTMFGEKLNGTDPEEVIRNAFACFDDENSGKSKFFWTTFLILRRPKTDKLFIFREYKRGLSSWITDDDGWSIHWWSSWWYVPWSTYRPKDLWLQLHWGKIMLRVGSQAYYEPRAYGS